MKAGYLSQYFDGAAAKILREVETNQDVSSQHEFNGVEGLRNILGEPEGKENYHTLFMYLSDSEESPVMDEGYLTWYDARQKARIEKQVMRYEYRLYFPANRVSALASAGDILVIARKKDGELLAIVAEKDSTIAYQILWLFGFSDLSRPGFSVRDTLEAEKDRIEFASRIVLENIGIVVETPEENLLDGIVARFGKTFPSTKEFSAYARSTVLCERPSDKPDETLLLWLEREETLFRLFEKQQIGERLAQGFGDDVDGFIAFSLAVQNRRKSRAGLALENHLEEIFKIGNIKYSRAQITENKNKPDFLFPGIKEYRNPVFNSLDLTMLGVKSTCKDRWRQVLSEAKRINEKHVLTLEAAISTNQTDEMKAKKLQLVVPRKIHASYSPLQQKWLLDLESFISIIRERQVRSDS